MITNILVRIQEEQREDASRSLSCLHSKENEISKLSQAVGEKTNTLIPKEWEQRHRCHYQAHLERIADFLTEGPNAWWKNTEKGFEFFDAKDFQTENVLCKHHYRSSNLAEVNSYLLEQWETCIEMNITLPCTLLRTFM